MTSVIDVKSYEIEANFAAYLFGNFFYKPQLNTILISYSKFFHKALDFALTKRELSELPKS